MTGRYKGGWQFFLPRLFAAIDRRLRSALNTVLCRMSFRDFGKNSIIQDRVFVADPSRIQLGHSCLISSNVRLSSESSSGFLDLGNRVQINTSVLIDYTGCLKLEDDVLISEGAIIYTHDHGADPRSAPKQFDKIIETGAWVGARAIVLPGCRRIGAGSIVGAGAIVTSDVPARTIVAGNPARLIRKLNN